MKITLPTGVEIKVNILTVIKIVRLIRKYIKQHKKTKDIMCFKKMWEWITGQLAEETTTKEPTGSKQVVLSVIVGDYPGTANDLAGCPNDQVDFEKRLLSKWPYYCFEKYKDSQSTKSLFKNKLKEVVNQVGQGDVLLFIMDNCFSESNTRNPGDPKVLQNRFYPNPDLPRRNKINRRILRSKAGNYISMSACQDHETAADAYLDGRANGAYHYCLIKTMEKGITYLEWHNLASALIKKLGFAQTPTIEGPTELLNRQIFEGNVFCVEVSSHGTYTYDKDGDEADGQDEALYLYDGMVIDDEINEILFQNPYLH